MRKKFAICVGHSRFGDQGAISAGGVYEWEYWSGVAPKVAELLEPVAEVRVIDEYDGKSYGSAMSRLGHELKVWGADGAMELHFNAANGKARGFEYLHWDPSPKGCLLASDLEEAQDSILPDINGPIRGVKGKRSGDRGSGFLRKTPCPAVICEPFFGDNPEEWGRFAGAEERVADALAAGVADWLERRD